MEIVIAGQFKIIKKIGEGSFGEIYEAMDIQRGHKIAVKLEDINSMYPQLLHEARVMMELLGGDSIADRGLPNVYSKGTQGEFNYLVMDLLGGSLEDQLAKCSGSLSLKTTLMVAEQTLKRIEYLHSKGYLHRDIKPENFLLSAKDDRKILIIDFGLSRKYVKDGKHMAYAEGRNLMGTVRYASLNLHYGIEPTRRDDLESWFYSLRYLRLGGLPWQNQTGPKQAKYDKILALKLQQRPQLFCKDLPTEFLAMQNYIRGLKFEEKPNYEFLRHTIHKCMKNNNYEFDYKYDWQTKKQAANKLGTTHRKT